MLGWGGAYPHHTRTTPAVRACGAQYGVVLRFKDDDGDTRWSFRDGKFFLSRKFFLLRTTLGFKDRPTAGPGLKQGRRLSSQNPIFGPRIQKSFFPRIRHVFATVWPFFRPFSPVDWDDFLLLSDCLGGNSITRRLCVFGKQLKKV